MAVAIAGALVAGGCVGGGDRGRGARTTSTVRQAPADEAAARRIVLRASDLPETWSSSPPERTEEEEAEGVRFYGCLGLPPPAEANAAEVQSPEFEAEGAMISADVTFDRTRRIAQRELQAFRGPKFVECLAEGLDMQAPADSGFTILNQTVERRAAPDLGDGSVAVRFHATLTDGERSVEFTNVQIYVLVGRIWIGLQWSSTGEPMPEDVEEDLLSRMIDRAEPYRK